MTYKRFDVVKVPFPFTDRQAAKNRPALVLSDDEAFNSRIGHTVMAMITSAKHSEWPLDMAISDLQSAGLPAPSIIRMKFFTLDNRLIISALGYLAPNDQAVVEQHLQHLFGLAVNTPRDEALQRLAAVRGKLIAGDLVQPLTEEWTGDADNV